MRGVLLAALGVLAGVVNAQTVQAQATSGAGLDADWAPGSPPSLGDLDALIAEAARRFAVPQTWIRAVIRAESGFDPHAVSSAGAMGLMQLMPATYAEMRARHGLGADPFSPRDNLLAGSAYLRLLHDRFGSSGF